MIDRHAYTLALEITPTQAVTHGQGAAGNEQVLLTREYVIEGPDGWERVEVPAVSGASLRAQLREAAVRDALERAGIEPGTLGKDALRLLAKGGRTDSGGVTVSLDEARRLRDLFPLLAVWGSMDGGLPIRGLLEVSDVQVYAQELEAAGVLTRTVVPLAVIDADGGPLPEIPLYPGRAPIPAALTRTRLQYYRHDVVASEAGRYLQGAEVTQIEDQRQLLAARRAPKKEERREANESMPHSYQAITPGTPMYAILRLRPCTPAEWGCLVSALLRWVSTGAHLGGGSAKGHGSCAVRVSGALRHHPARGAAASPPGEAVDVAGRTPEAVAVAAYEAHLIERREAIRSYLLGVPA